MFSKEYIINQLKELGVPNDGVIIIHTALRAIGEVEGRAQGLLNALKEYFTAGGGVLVVPTHTWSNFYGKKEYALNTLDNKTCLGTFSDVAAADADGVRTLNPTHSVVAFGNKERVKELVDSENLSITPTSPDGCYGKLTGVLLVGVGQNKNTYLHCVEESLGIKNRLSASTAKMAIKLFDGKVIYKDFYYMISEGIEDPSVFFNKYETPFRKYGAIKDGFIGNAKVQFCDTVKMKTVMELINENSNGVELLADDKPLDRAWY